MEFCYVLFVKTGREMSIVHNLKKKLDSSKFLPFVPTKEKYFKKDGNIIKESEVCFQGYIFIESSLCVDKFIIEIFPIIRMTKEIYRIVNYGNSKDIAMRESERSALSCLYGDKYCIEISTGFIEGDKVKVYAGPLAGRESIIRKINRHKREAMIEIEIMGGLRCINVGLEIIKKR